MFITAHNDREAYSEAGLLVAADIETAKAQFMAEWPQVYDVSTLTLNKVNEDLSVTTLFVGDGDDVDYDAFDEDRDRNEDGSVNLTIKAARLSEFNEAMAALAG